MTHADLLRVIYRFYPRDLYPNSPGYAETEERRRQLTAARAAAVEYPKWKAMLGRLRARYVVGDWSLHLLSGGHDPAYSGYVEVPEGAPRRMGIHVCILAPYYGIAHTGTPDEEPHVRELAREVEATYGGALIPPELGNIVVPDVTMDTRGLGEATIYDCLLSTVWGWSTAGAHAEMP